MLQKQNWDTITFNHIAQNCHTFTVPNKNPLSKIILSIIIVFEQKLA